MRYACRVALSPTAHRFTVKDYHRMAEADIFRPKQRVELLDGEVLEMSPIGLRHAACVNRLAFLFHSQLGESGMVRVQHPIELEVDRRRDVELDRVQDLRFAIEEVEVADFDPPLRR